MLKIGQKLSDKEISNQTFEVFQDKKFSEIKLSDYKGKWLVLIFYPSDFTFVCPTELQEMAKNYDSFKELDAEVISISTDSVFVHKAWHDESPAIKEITYPMLADPTGNLCREFGIYIEKEGVSLRGSFIIDPDTVLKAFEVHDNSVGRSAKELLRKLQAAIFVRENNGEVCPASWTPGEETLKPGIELVGKV